MTSEDPTVDDADPTAATPAAGERAGGDRTVVADEEADGEGPTDTDAAPDDDTEDDEEESGTDPRVRSAIEWIAVLVGAVVIALVVRTFLFTTFWIPTGSMEPTLMGAPRNDRVVVNRLSYKLHDVNRGDIVVFEVPPGEPITTVNGQRVEELIKRVVGLPGETVSLRDGQVYIDGARLEEPYLVEGTRTDPCVDQSEFVVPEDSVFVMGDNRTQSRDARCWTVHSIETDSIVGRAFVRIWPLSEFGGL